MFSPRRFSAITQNIHIERTYPQGRNEHPVRSAPKTKLRPAIRPGARSAVRPTALLGFQSLRRFAPDREWRDVSICRACMPFVDSFAAINFRRGIGRLGGTVDLKKTNDHELVVAASRLHSRVRSAPPGFSPHGRDPAMGFASLRTSGTTLRAFRAGTTPRGSSASGNRFRPLSAHGFDDKLRTR